jgi:hypothetical protein
LNSGVKFRGTSSLHLPGHIRVTHDFSVTGNDFFFFLRVISATTQAISGAFLGKSANLVVPLAFLLANGPVNAIFLDAPPDSETLAKGRKGWDSNP